MDARTKKLMDKVLDIGIHDKEGMLSVMKEVGQMGKSNKSKGPRFTVDSKGNVTKNYKSGGEVPAKFKGFSKLPEEVQMKMNPQAAKKYKYGGCVMSGRGGSFKGTR